MRSDSYLELLLTHVKKSVHHAHYMYISRFRCGVDHIYFVLASKKLNLGETLLFQVNLPLLEHFVDKRRYSTILIADNLINI